MNERVAIVDLDGTVYRGDSLIDGAIEGIDHLRDAGFTIRYVSNSPTATPSEYAHRLQSMGLEARPEQVYSSGSVTTAVIAERHPDADIFVIGSDGLKAQLREADLSLIDDPQVADILLVSLDRNFGYSDMVDALATPDPVFYGTDPDRTIPKQGDHLVPGSGSIVAAISSVLGRDPDQIFGKPSQTMLTAALSGTDADPADCLIIGDKRSTDIALGEDIGATTVLLRTGVDTGAVSADSTIRPDHVIERLGTIDQVI